MLDYCGVCGYDTVALGFRGRGGIGEQRMELAVFSPVRVRFVLGMDLGSLGVPRAWGTRKSRLLHNDPLLRFVDDYLFFSRIASTHLTRQILCLPFLPVRLVLGVDLGSLAVLRAWDIRNSRCADPLLR